MASRLGHADEAVGGVAVLDAEVRDAEIAGVDGDHLQAFAFALEGDGFGIAGGAHPFDGNGAAAGADIPEQRAGIGREPREGRGADVALGELAVGDEGVVREAGRGGEQRCARIGDAVDGEDVEIAEGEIEGAGFGGGDGSRRGRRGFRGW